MLISVGKKHILTDPWYLTNAFGGWVQKYHPSKEDIDLILNLNREDLLILISHGHDDHCDDNFIKHNFSEVDVVTAKFPTAGFKNRLKVAFKNDPIEISEGETFSWGEFKINSYINEDFTHYDALYGIVTPDNLIIHANDNWHEQSDKILQDLKLSSQGKDIYYFSQLGLADCYPMMYHGIDKEDKISIMRDRCKKQVSAFKNNISKINPKLKLSYANQSYLVNLNENLPSPYDIMQETIQECGDGITQMKPSMQIENNRILNGEKKLNLFDYCLVGLEKKINNYIKNHTELSIKLLTDDKCYKDAGKNQMVYWTTKNVWQDIFEGNLNLEAIGVGGLGIVSHHKDSPLSEKQKIHHTVSKYGYLIENNVKTKGIIKFLNHA